MLKFAVTLADKMTQAILDILPYIVWLKDTQGRYIKINKMYVDYVRLQNSEQIIGKIDIALWPTAHCHDKSAGQCL